MFVNKDTPGAFITRLPHAVTGSQPWMRSAECCVRCDV
jgi:hypothetical protein